ncbi:DMT family transporter [Erwinia piriflorinigrans]|uniref:Putative transporter yoaV n=1 Tax=Erwinia piriflorinigrans CFBP 5888 TaxID=1161919 RepID=V5ZCE7_9GAMM|nr:DMT family transporter [Erwinia piriflorinigrans]CCG89033.1 putative transporter yoaV [Erwinia piriflorinigrans CFBP 5888]
MKQGDMGRLLLLAAIWGASFLFMRVATPVFGSLNTAFFRVFFGCLGLLALLLVMRTPFNFKGKALLAMLLGVINSAVPLVMYCMAAKWLPAGYSAILNATTPLMGVLIGGLFFSETLNLRKVGGVVLGLVGIAVLTTSGTLALSHSVLLGIAACLIATACYALAGFMTKKWIGDRGGLDAKLVAFGSQLGALIFMLPLFVGSISTQPAVDWHHPGVWLCVLALGLVCTAWAYILFFRLIADIGPLRTLTVTFLIPPFGVLWGYLFLGETLSQGFIAGALLIILAVWLVTGAAAPRLPRSDVMVKR